MRRVLLAQELNSWTENPTTELVKIALEAEIDKNKKLRLETYIAGNPQETQERILYLRAKQEVLLDMVDILSGDTDRGTQLMYFQDEVELIEEKVSGE